MLNVIFTRQFKRDIKRQNKRGKDIEKFKAIAILLEQGKFPDKK